MSAIKWTRRTTSNISLQLATFKWNPIEHRLFNQIRKNWAGESLTDIDKALHFIRTIKTKPGLVVTAQLIADTYDKGIKITDAEMPRLYLLRHDTLGRWNYSARQACTVCLVLVFGFQMPAPIIHRRNVSSLTFTPCLANCWLAYVDKAIA